MTAPPLYFGAIPRHVEGVGVVLDTLLSSKLLVQANSGGGKSHAIRYLLEQTHGHVQHIVLDREGEFATLRAKYPYVLAGREGDIAADGRTAKLLARRMLETGLSLIVDLSEMSLAQQREYVRVFVETINHLPRTLWKDCLIVIDEAHLFAPEKGKGASVASEAIALLLSTGRKRGYCAVLATQRIAKLDKDVAAECLNKLIGRTSEEDLARAGDELGMDKATRKALRSLEPGTFYAYGPAITPDPVLVRTGAVVTAPPKRGAQRAPAPVAPDAIKRALAAELADLPKQAAEEEQTVAQLRKRIAELERAHKAGPVKTVEKLVADPRAIERAVKEAGRLHNVRYETLRSRVDRFTRAMLKHVETMGNTATGVHSSLVELRGALVEADVSEAEQGGAAGHSDVGVRPVRAAGGGPVASRPLPPAPSRVPVEGELKLGRTGQAILNALAFFESIGYPEAPHSWLGGIVGASVKGGGWGARVSELRTAGLVTDSQRGILTLTDAGRARADSSGAPRSLDALHQMWLAKQGATGRKMLEALLAVYPNSLTRDQLAEAVGASAQGGGFGARLSELRTPGLIEDVARGEVRAAKMLFPEGLH